MFCITGIIFSQISLSSKIFSVGYFFLINDIICSISGNEKIQSLITFIPSIKFLFNTTYPSMLVVTINHASKLLEN